MRTSKVLLTGACAAALGLAGCATTPMTASMPMGDGSCDSACLEDLLERYVAAWAAKDPAAAPVAADLLFSENGVFQPFGEASWLTMEGRGPYWLPITDPAAGEAAVFTTMVERGDTEQVTVRIKVEDGLIVEAEQMIVRPTGGGGGSAGGAQFVREPQTSPDPRLTAPVPPEERVGRDELIAIADSYFEGIDTATDSSITPFWEDCQRRENNTITSNNPDAPEGSMANLACGQQFDTGFQIIVTDIRDRRITVADIERQLVFGYAFFDHSGVGNPNTTTGTFAKPFTFQIGEVFKVRDGKIQQVEAILFAAPYRLRTDFDRYYEDMGVPPNHGR
jgi:hypothetical protein